MCNKLHFVILIKKYCVDILMRKAFFEYNLSSTSKKYYVKQYRSKNVINQIYYVWKSVNCKHHTRVSDCKRDCEGGLGGVYGISKLCRPMGLSCLKKVEEVICDHGIPEQPYYVLPMQLPNKCVTSQICINEPPVVEFQRAAGLPLERPRRRLL